MVTVSKNNNSTADQRIAELERELMGTQEMLAFVLAAVGEPVEVSKELLDSGLPENATIAVDDDVQRELFVFSLVSGATE